jgi:DNA polymerase/3'-5' exonuclease PolX
MKLEEARNIALEIWNKMKDLCEPGQCKIAGSIRREKPEVKDIEIVSLPKTVEVKDLFDKVTGRVRIKEWVELVYSLGEAVKGNPNGKYNQIILRDRDIKLDLFMPDADDYYRQLVIRTGSAEWVKTYIAGGWVKQGWVGTKEDGLMMRSQCLGFTLPTKHVLWKSNVPESQKMKPPAWKSEREFFEWLKLQWVEPKNRNI